MNIKWVDMAYNLAILFRQTYVQTGDTPGDIAGIGIPIQTVTSIIYVCCPSAHHCT